MALDTRNAVVDFVREFSGQTVLPVTRVVGWLGIGLQLRERKPSWLTAYHEVGFVGVVAGRSEGHLNACVSSKARERFRAEVRRCPDWIAIREAGESTSSVDGWPGSLVGYARAWDGGFFMIAEPPPIT